MSGQTNEKEKHLAELMARILKEPLKPLEKSVAGLGGELSDIKEEAEQTSSTLSLCLTEAENAAKQSKEAVHSLGRLRDEQSAWVPTLKDCIAEHARSGVQAIEAQLGAHADRNASALATVTGDVLSALTSISQDQRSAAQAIGALPMHLSRELGETNASLASMGQVLQEQILQGQAVFDKALVQSGTQLASAQAMIASGLKDTTREVSQLVVHQQRIAQATHQAVLNEIKDSAGQAQSQIAESLHVGKLLCESLNNSHIELMAALSQHTEVLNTRLDQSQTKVRHLTITTGCLFVSMLAYIAYDLLSKLS
ncbi:hypothetical protein VPH49_23905 [Pseudomonas luteola]|uniref:hypothetical protein n=1 Tax=Pseudomonas luteola TaxID=47886 RepID=UPI00123C741B|nr:hypothetical protein [Pseudomonas luteola]QEU26280.1 hypothetical protein FOB45_00190 [Pseudomonas luteola]